MNDQVRPDSDQPPEGEENLKSIAEASEELGVTQRTLRFYEDKGLIQPQRVGAMRVYSKREMGRMLLILRGKQLGFSIREIGEFLALYDAEHGQVGQMQHLLRQVTHRVSELRIQREAIDETLVELELIEQQVRDHLSRH